MRNAYTANDNIVYTMLITRSAHVSLLLLVAKLSFCPPPNCYCITPVEHQIS
jgi:hypothetical protein